MKKQKKSTGSERSEPSAPVRIAELTDTGMIREENQDHVFHQKMKGGSLCAVCDGMGGHAGGRQASHLAMDALFQVFKKSVSSDIRKRLGESVVAANSAVWKMANKKRALHGMGTTCVALFVDETTSSAYVAHVGDSRCYLSRGTRFQLITRDHTVVQRMLDDGLLTREQAEHHPHANVIARSLGGAQTVDVDVSEAIPLDEGDLFLLCSDGLTGLVSEKDIVELLWSKDLDVACQALIDLANESGGTDNVTAQLVSYGARPKQPEHFEFLHPARKPSPEIRAMLDRHHQRHENETSPVRAVSAVPASRESVEVSEDEDSLEAAEPAGTESPEAAAVDETDEEIAPAASPQDDGSVEAERDASADSDGGDDEAVAAEEESDLEVSEDTNQAEESESDDETGDGVEEPEEVEETASDASASSKATERSDEPPVQTITPSSPSLLRVFGWIVTVLGFAVLVLYWILRA